MIEVVVRQDDEKTTWRRVKKNEWFHWDSCARRWVQVLSSDELHLLEVGFQYGRDFLRWQISQLRME